MSSPSRSLARDRNFAVFWAGQTFSVLGDAVALIAIPLLVLDATGSLARMGLVTALFGVGSLIAGIAAGPLVDRLDRRRLMIRCDLGRAALYALVPLCWWLIGPQLWLVYVVTVVGAAFGMLFGVAYITAVANLVDRDRLTEANGRLQATAAVAFVVGPMLAGLVSGRFGPTAAVGIDAATFLVSAASLTRVRLRRAAAVRPPAGVGEGGKPPPGRRQEFLAGVRFLVDDPLFRTITLLMGVLAFVATGATDLFIFLLKDDFGQSDRGVGIVFGIAAVGSTLGGVLTPALRRRWGFGACFVGGFALEGLALLGAGFVPSVAGIAAVAALFTFAEGVRGIATMSLRQELTPDHLLGRVTAAFWTVFSVPGPLGAAAVTALGERIGVPAAFRLMGALVLLLAALAARGPARARFPTRSDGRPNAADAPSPVGDAADRPVA